MNHDAIRRAVSEALRPAWEGLAKERPARPGLNRGGHGAPPYQRPAMQAMATRDVERSLGGGESSRNQLENTAQGALEMTGLPSVRRSARAFASGDPATGLLQGGLGALGLMGMVAGVPRGAGAARPMAMESPPARLPVNPARPMGRAAEQRRAPPVRRVNDDVAQPRPQPPASDGGSLDESSQRALRDWYLSDPLRDHSRLPALVHGAASAPIVEIPVSAFGRALARGGARLDSVTAAGTDVPPILFIRSPHGIELIDGNNRLAAARADGRATIKARDLTDVAALHRGQK